MIGFAVPDIEEEAPFIAGPDAPVAVMLDYVGGNLPDYDRLMAMLEYDLRDGQTGPEGRILHWVRATPDGVRVIELWRRRELFDDSLEHTLLDALSAAGLPRPELAFYDVHNYVIDRADSA